MASYAIARQLSLDMEALEVFKSRDIEVKYCVAEKGRALVALAQCVFEGEDAITAIGESRNLREEHRRQRRILHPPPPGQTLQISDGLRCDSHAEAYPRVIQLLRSTEGYEYKDHMGRTFRELSGFKLVLQRPALDRIPDYWSKEESELEEYYQREFVSDQGLFGSRLRKWGFPSTGPTDQFAAGIASAAREIRHNIASRRVILFIAQPTDDLDKPLGLVCIHVMPRSRGGRWHIDFEWVWRTVEALVGFPFSAYASIRYSEEFVNTVNESLTGDKLQQASMGQITYTALSLHLFLEEGDDDIARTVVTDAYA